MIDTINTNHLLETPVGEAADYLLQALDLQFQELANLEDDDDQASDIGIAIELWEKSLGEWERNVEAANPELALTRAFKRRAEIAPEKLSQRSTKKRRTASKKTVPNPEGECVTCGETFKLKLMPSLACCNDLYCKECFS